MGRADEYRLALRRLGTDDAWRSYLLAGSGLPGPRANLELLAAFVEEASPDLTLALARLSPADAPAGTAAEFLPACGTAGLGRLLAEGDGSVLDILCAAAADPRWRVREAAAIALQRLGDAQPARLGEVASALARGSRYEQRAAVAGLCEPRLLRDPRLTELALELLDTLTASLEGAPDRREEGFRVLRKALGYCWSVAIVTDPARGKSSFERWLATADPDVRWVVRENLRKARLGRLDADWVAACLAALA